MRLRTTQGVFDTLAELRYAYMQSGEDMNLDPGHTGANDWESHKLHASEIGYCPRATAYRLLGAPKKVQANLTKANEALMFWQGYRIHYLTYEAMMWGGILVAYEVPVLDTEVWAGRADAIFLPDFQNEDEEWLYDAKTTRPNAFKFARSFPKEEACLQLGAYGTKRPNIHHGIIEYIDRGGSNIPVECEIDVDKWARFAAQRMVEREFVRDTIAGKDLKTATLPPVLEQEIVPEYRKARNMPYKDLKGACLKRNWQCSYCDYHATDPETDETRLESICFPPAKEVDAPYLMSNFASRIPVEE